MERLTAEDRLMLWPDERWPQEIGALAVLDGASLLDPGGRLRIEAVRQAVEARLHLVPRFRQLLHVPRRGLGGPLWVDATAFDLADHVREYIGCLERVDEVFTAFDTGTDLDDRVFDDDITGGLGRDLERLQDRDTR